MNRPHSPARPALARPALARPATAALAVALAGVATGCTVGPNYAPPVIQVAPAWSEPTATPAAAPDRPFTPPSRTVSNVAPAVQWWTTFRDPELDSLVARAVESNYDLRRATLRVREARAQRATVSADLYPTVDATGEYSHTRVSKNGVTSQIGGGGSSSAGSGGGGATGGTGGSGGNGGGVGNPPGANGSPAIPGQSLSEFDLYQVGFDASWEIDVFGRTRRAVQAADATIQSNIEDRRDVLLTLLGDVARNYVELRGTQRQLALARENLVSQQKTLDLTRQQVANGIADELNVARARAQVETTAAEIPPLQTTISQSIHALGILLGEQPQALYAELTAVEPIPPVPDTVPIGLPGDLLRRRPDVRRAERDLAAATANVGVAVADLYPQFSLTGTLGLQSVDSDNIFEFGSRYFTIAPGVSYPLFDAGKLRAQVRVQGARQEQALASYQQSVLVALRDVEDALIAYAKQQERRQSLAQAVSANQKAVRLATEQFTQGLTDFLTVLDAQRNLFTSQDSLAQSETAVSTNLVTLYKALGGGWELERSIYANPNPAAPVARSTSVRSDAGARVVTAIPSGPARLMPRATLMANPALALEPVIMVQASRTVGTTE